MRPATMHQASVEGDDLCPHRNHPDEQRQRRKDCGFFDDGTEHWSPSPKEHSMNIIHVMFLVKWVETGQGA